MSRSKCATTAEGRTVLIRSRTGVGTAWRARPGACPSSAARSTADPSPKDVPPEQLGAGIRSVAARDTLLAPSVTRRLIQEFVRRPPDTLRSSAPELARLTAREVEVLHMMARGRSNTEIATDLFVSETT